MIPLKDNIQSRSIPFANILLIGINLFVFFVEFRQPSPESLERFVSHWALYPAALFSRPLENGHRIFTSMFVHGGLFHLLGNMIFLWIFGDNVEDRVGHIRYIFFYGIVGGLAGLSQAFVTRESVIPMVGASGAVAGVLGAYFVLYPRAKILTAVPIFVFLKIVEIPAFFFLGIWFFFQWFHGYGRLIHTTSSMVERGGVAWWAHAGGFLSGLILIFIFRKSKNKNWFFN